MSASVRSRWIALAIALTALAGCGRAPELSVAPAVPDGATVIPHEFLVKYRSGRTTQAIEPLLRDVDAHYTAASVGFDADDDLRLVRMPASSNDSATLASLKASARVEWALPNYRVDVRSAYTAQAADDPLRPQQWYLDKIGAPDAWARSTGKGVVVAVLDTGVDDQHPDLAGQIINGPNYADSGSAPKDGFGHGTHVAGIVAAKAHDGNGITGVAPDARVLNVEVLGADGSGSLFAIARGIKYAADYAKREHVHVVINMSLGGSSSWDPLSYLAGRYAHLKGALLVAAAGNAGGPVASPARLSDYLAVGATTQDDHRASFSNFGPQLAIAAPGVSILSTMPTYHVKLNDYKDAQGKAFSERYTSLQGTSMATPVVSGVAALTWSSHPDWTADQVRDRLETTARALASGGRSPEFGFGMVNAAAAVR